MTYLQLVNGVLSRLREDEVASVSNSDVVANLVADFVNDAKRLVEDAHTWNALRTEWSITTASGTHTYSLTGAGRYANVEYILDADGQPLSQQRLQKLRKDRASGADGKPMYYAVAGQDASADVQLTLGPTPDAVYSFDVYGFKHQEDLALDGDVLLIPSKPVLYYALAMAARERGEVGGQTAAEIFQLAGAYLGDAIAHDASMSDLDNIWEAV